MMQEDFWILKLISTKRKQKYTAYENTLCECKHIPYNPVLYRIVCK